MPQYPDYQPLPAGWTCAIADEYDIGLPFLLWRARQMAVARLLPVLRDRKLTEPQWRMLRMLQFYGKPLSQTEIARVAGFYVTHVRRTAEHLWHYGAVDWFKKDHRRATHKQHWKLGLTPFGHKLIARVQNDLAERRHDTRALFGEADARMLRRLLLRYIKSISWTPNNSEAAMFDPLYHSHDKAKRRNALAYQIWKARQKAMKERRYTTRDQIRAELANV